MQQNRGERLTIATYTAILMVATLGFSRSAAAQTVNVAPPIVQFSSEADAISGSVTKTTLGLLQQPTVTIAPVDQSTTVTLGYNDVPANSAVQNVFGVEVYNLSTIEDITLASDTGAQDSGQATANTGPGSLLGGLISWTSNSVPLFCFPDAHISGQVDCQDFAKTQALIINGVTITPGTFPAGVSFPVTGPINDSQCFFGAETFSGTLVAQETQFTGDGTTAPSIKLIGLHLVGDATCSTQETIALTLFRTHYDLAIGGTTLTQQEKSGNGTLHIIIQPVYSLLPLGDS